MDSSVPQLSFDIPAPAIQIEMPILVRRRPAILRFWPVVGVLVLLLAVLVVTLRLRQPVYPVARPGETLIVIGPFANYAGGQQGYNVAGRIQTALEREIRAGRLENMRVVVWPENLSDATAAQAAGIRSGAAVLIWGEYDSGRVLSRFTMPSAPASARERQVEDLLGSPSDLPTTINSALPEEVRYMALLILAQLDLEKGDGAQARALLNQALTRPPAEPDALAALNFWLGYAYQVSQPADLDRAIDLYTRVLETQPGLVSAHNNRGIAYLRRGQAGDPERAIADLGPVIAEWPDDGAAYSNRGTAYLQRNSPGDTGRAIEDLNRAVALAPDSVAAYYNRGLAYVREGERGRWKSDFERSLQLQPDHAGALGALCWAYALDLEPQAALPYCDKAVAHDPTGLSRDSRGIVNAELGRLPEAVADFEAFLAWVEGQQGEMSRQYVPERQRWLQALRSGKNPFDRQTLESLRQE